MATENVNSQETAFSIPNLAIAPKAEDNKVVLVSERKLRANQQNAKRSTGPRTLRGKANSRRNATKHGFFASSAIGFAILGEDSLEYAELRQALWNHYQPAGRAEELEVERITVCWWKHKRTWRYENSANLRSRFSAEERLIALERNCKKLAQEDEAIILELRNGEKQIRDTGKLPEEIKQTLFTMRPVYEDLWQFLSGCAEAEFNASNLNIIRAHSPEERVALITLSIQKAFIVFMEKVLEIRSREFMEVALAEHVVPNADTLDKLIRYEAATDRNLSRSIDRLERLQGQRRAIRSPNRPAPTR